MVALNNSTLLFCMMGSLYLKPLKVGSFLFPLNWRSDLFCLSNCFQIPTCLPLLSYSVWFHSFSIISSLLLFPNLNILTLLPHVFQILLKYFESFSACILIFHQNPLLDYLVIWLFTIQFSILKDNFIYYSVLIINWCCRLIQFVRDLKKKAPL